jgi:excisionase family DNA binding protein
MEAGVSSLPKLINIKELCNYLDVSEKTAYILVRGRDFLSVKIGGKYRIIVDDLVGWLEKQSRKRK